MRRLSDRVQPGAFTSRIDNPVATQQSHHTEGSELYKVMILLAPLFVLFAASSARAATVHFDSGSDKVRSGHVERHKHKVWVPAHRSKGRLVKGHYIWR
jgi:hypothetical protein